MHRWFYLSSLLGAASLGVLAAVLGFVSISFDALEASDLGTLFLTLLFVALVIERAVEVYVSNKFHEREMAASRGVRLSARKLKVRQDALTTAEETVALSTATGAALTSLKKSVSDRQDAAIAALHDYEIKRDAAQSSLDALSTQKTGEAVGLAILLSGLSALVGVRLLGALFPETFTLLTNGPSVLEIAKTDAENAGLAIGIRQHHTLTAFDVLLTTLLLAGGADGIHQLIKDFLGKRKDLLPDI